MQWQQRVVFDGFAPQSATPFIVFSLHERKVNALSCCVVADIREQEEDTELVGWTLLPLFAAGAATSALPRLNMGKNEVCPSTELLFPSCHIDLCSDELVL